MNPTWYRKIKGKRGFFLSLAFLLFVSSGGLFLSAWIVIPAPTMVLLPLGVGAPEVSPWLVVLNAIAFFSLLAVRHHPILRLALASSLVALCLSLLPLMQIPSTVERLTTAMQKGTDRWEIPGEEQAKMRSRPFILTDTFRGINPGKARYTADVPFTPSLSLDIYRPILTGQYPALVIIYGGAWQRGDRRQNADFNRYMAARGYTVFAIDYRHAPQYRYPAQLQDIQTALRFIRQHAAQYEADPSRIAIVGRSAGAHLAMLAAYQPDAQPLRAVVSYYGPVNLTQAYNDPPRPDPIDSRAVLETFLGGSPVQFPLQYQAASPISYVTQPQPPTLLLYGGRDLVVQAKFGRQMRDRLQKVGSPAIYLEIPWAEHSFDAVFAGISNQLALYYTERFLAWALR